MKARRYRPESEGAALRRRPSHSTFTGRPTAAVTASTPIPDLPAGPIALTTVVATPGTTAPEKRRWSAGRLVRWTLGVTGVVLAVGATWAVITLVRFQDRIYKALPPTATVAAVTSAPTVVAANPFKTPVPTPTVDRLRDLPPGRFNVLVLGTDKRPDDTDHWPRSDTLLLANVDTVSRTVRIMSIPRDLVVEIPGYGENKVNAAYLFGEYYKEPGGGQALSVQTVSKFFDVPIAYYVAVNFDGFRKVIDTIGGITVDVPYTLDDYDYPTDDEGDPYGTTHVHFAEGLQNMDGKTALRYARTRHADNDFARSRRQLQIINAVRQKAMKLDLLPKVPGLIDDLGGMIETNIPFDQQLAMAQLGYNLGPTGVVTASIDASMIVPTYLDDGSEGFGLDWDVAGPMLDDFFGLTVAAGTEGAGGGSRAAQDVLVGNAQAEPKSGSKVGSASSTSPAASPTPRMRR